MAQIVGTPRDDHLTGTSVTDSPTGADDIFGLAGNDQIDGRSGNDRLFGGPGDDQLLGSVGADVLFGEDDDDVLRGGPGADQLFGGNGRDLLLGDDGDDLLAGDSGDDNLLGGAGGDHLDGGDANDNLFGDAGDDRLNGGPGPDRHQGGPGADRFELIDLDAVDDILDFDLSEGDGVDVSLLTQDAIDAGAMLQEVVHLRVTPAGTLVSIDPDGGADGFGGAALLRGVLITELTAAELGLDLPPPVAVDDSATTDQRTAITINPLANDQGQGDRLSIIGLDSTETRGAVAIDPGGLTVTYAPDPAFFGIDAFRYTVANSLGETDEAEVRVGVLGTAELADIARNDDPRGFALNGINPGDDSGYSVSGTGDINGDGLDDVIVGAPDAAAPYGSDNPGQSYIVFGKVDGTAVELSDVANDFDTGGFALNGINDNDRSGFSVSGAGDVDGDGLADLIIGAPGADPNSNYSGQSYVVFGQAGGNSVRLLHVVSGVGGFALNGVDSEQSGSSVSDAGDVNGDGFADIIVGAPTASRSDDISDTYIGRSYVVFGKADGTTVELINVLAGSGGFAMNGVDNYDFSGSSVSGAGDVNGDGFADVIVGAPGDEDPTSGDSYVVFGKADGTLVELADVVAGIGGFSINNTGGFVYAGSSVSGVGDINGDGLADVIIDDPYEGQTYMVFGKTDGTLIQLSDIADGIGGFALNRDPGLLPDRGTVSGAGDVNGDGTDDVIIGGSTGRSHVVFGKSDTSNVELSDVAAGIGGFALSGIDDRSDLSVSGAGDVNGDGFADVVVGASGRFFDPGSSGQSYVVFGGDFTGSVDLLGTTGNETLQGTANGEIIVGAQGDDTLLGGGGVDILNGAAGDDLLGIGDVGFRKLLGGTGTDTIRLDGVGDVLDVTAVSDLFVRDVEQIDLNGQDNELVLNTLEILNIDDNSNTLAVFGEATNAVSGDLSGATVGQTTVGGVTFDSFTVGNAELLVQTPVDSGGIVV